MNRNTDTSGNEQSGVATSKKLRPEPETSSFSSISIIGHRGAGARSINKHAIGRPTYPENSLIGFREIMQLGAEGIEFDLHLSVDNKLMVVHDDELSINCFGVVIKQNSRNEDGSDIGNKYKLETKADFIKRSTGGTYKLLVSKYPSYQLRAEFDISMGFNLDGVSEAELQLYTKMPLLSEVLELVMLENIRRKPLSIPSVLLNIELKGPRTGAFVAQEFKIFNAKYPGHEIANSDIYYMSFHMDELKYILNNMPNANIVLGVPTFIQYFNVDTEFNIQSKLHNVEGLNKIIAFNDLVKLTTGRENRGLDGVDMSIWDVSQATIEYFCKDLQLPIHLAIVPFCLETLQSEYIEPVLSNFWKIIDAQVRNLTECNKASVFVKTDEPIRLLEYLKNRRTETDVDMVNLDYEVYTPKSSVKYHAYEAYKNAMNEPIPLFLKAAKASKVRPDIKSLI